MMTAVLLSLTLATGTLAWTGSNLAGLSFQAENQLTADSHASLLLSPLPLSPSTASDLSVCLWFKVLHFRLSSSYIFSYATTDKRNNELNFGIRDNKLVMAMGGKYLQSVAPSMTYVPDEWYHFCVVTNSTQETAAFYLDGEMIEEKNLTRREILLNGSLVLGQETDRVEGGFSAQQSFSGIIYGFNLYSRSLSFEEVGTLAGCDGAGEEGDLVAWSSSEWTLAGHVRHEDLPKNFCDPDRFRFVVIPKPLTSEAARNLCRSLKTTLAIPGNSEENTQLYEATMPLVGQCQPPNHASVFFILGAEGVPGHGVWTDFQGATLNYTNFGTFTSYTWRRCVGYLVPPYRGKWTDLTCNENYKFCAGCQEKKPAVMRVRGLCDQNPHTSYFRLEQNLGEMPSFRGFTNYYISYNNNNSTWTLLDMWTGNPVATTFVRDMALPLGRRNWRVTSDFVLCGKRAGASHLLSLSGCFPDEYTCGDGTCISRDKRCDLRVDCPDNTDETGCEKLQKPTEYLKSLPPPSPHPGPLALNLSVNIQGFSQVDIQDMKLTVDFSTVITWYDQRLDFKNLKFFSDLNIIDVDDVWTPEIELVNADFPNVHTTTATLTAMRDSPPEKDHAIQAHPDELYKGKKNRFRRYQKISAPFSCNMDLRSYPFDSQHCHLQLRLSARNEFLKWHHLSVDYLGETLLTEYKVGQVEGWREEVTGYSQATIAITLKRRYSYYLTSTYLPTIMLMLIGYASLFVPLEKSDLRVMMALTTLLVLYALYQQIADGLPKTSYVKAIDIWCFFAMTFIFTQVKVMGERQQSRLIMVSRILHVFILILFCGVYWGCC